MKYVSLDGLKAFLSGVKTLIAAETSAREASEAALKEQIDDSVTAIGGLVYSGTIGGRTVTFYAGRTIADLGTVTSSSVAETWAKRADVCGSTTLRLILYYDKAKGQTALLINTYSSTNDKAMQFLHLGTTWKSRFITGIASATEAGTSTTTTFTTWADPTASLKSSITTLQTTVEKLQTRVLALEQAASS